MKHIEIIISNDTFVDFEIKNVENFIPETTKNTPEFSVIFPQIKACISDFYEKARRLSLEGTTIYIKREFSFSGVSIFVILQYPRNITFIEKIKKLLKRD